MPFTGHSLWPQWHQPRGVPILVPAGGPSVPLADCLSTTVSLPGFLPVLSDQQLLVALLCSFHIMKDKTSVVCNSSKYSFRNREGRSLPRRERGVTELGKVYRVTRVTHPSQHLHSGVTTEFIHIPSLRWQDELAKLPAEKLPTTQRQRRRP